jgi:hypothetical protein
MAFVVIMHSTYGHSFIDLIHKVFWFHPCLTEGDSVTQMHCLLLPFCIVLRRNSSFLLGTITHEKELLIVIGDACQQHLVLSFCMVTNEELQFDSDFLRSNW